MTALLLSPHNDDETLFAAFTCVRHRPHVVTVLRSFKQKEFSVRWAEREEENRRALLNLGCHVWRQWAGDGFGDDSPDWDKVRHLLSAMRDAPLGGEHYTTVYAPAVEEGGHEQHNAVGELADEVFTPHADVIHYMTYRRGEGKSLGHEVVPTGNELSCKLHALAQYRSQLDIDNVRPWFIGDLREYLQP